MMFLKKMEKEINEDALALIRSLNHGQMIGEGDVSYHPRSHLEFLKSEKLQRDNEKYLANRKPHEKMLDACSSIKRFFASFFK
jgi:hypothetical protein